MQRELCRVEDKRLERAGLGPQLEGVFHRSMDIGPETSCVIVSGDCVVSQPISANFELPLGELGDRLHAFRFVMPAFDRLGPSLLVSDLARNEKAAPVLNLAACY